MAIQGILGQTGDSEGPVRKYVQQFILSEIWKLIKS
jgi:hypothetical protein